MEIWQFWKEKNRPMAKNFKQLRAKMSTERRARVHAEADRLEKEMALDQLREALNMTQEQLAQILEVNQAAISKLERRSDMYLSTLRKFIEAMGGELDIRAVFPAGAVRIVHFQELRKRA
jgi:DNA-binding XRE family transcriptional regulator